MKIAFTLCSINYLAQAKTLGDSLKETNPDYKYIIGLVDKNVNNIDLSFVKDYEILWVEDVKIKDFQSMYEQYNIVELVTSVKPFYFRYLFDKYKEASLVLYFDPDIMVFSSLFTLESKLRTFDIALTPHFTVPIKDDKLPTEKHVYNTGVFNLGFLGLSRSTEADKLLNWWMEKLAKECILDLTRGYFVDQLWMNLVPAYFNNVLIEKEPGYNMAHWNLHERYITKENGEYRVNNQPLVFYHFSHYSPSKPENIASYHNRFNFINRPDIKLLFDEYNINLKNNLYFELITNKCFYLKNEKKKELEKRIKAFLRKNVPLSVKMKVSKLIRG